MENDVDPRCFQATAPQWKCLGGRRLSSFSFKLDEFLSRTEARVCIWKDSASNQEQRLFRNGSETVQLLFLQRRTPTSEESRPHARPVIRWWWGVGDVLIRRTPPCRCWSLWNSTCLFCSWFMPHVCSVIHYEDDLGVRALTPPPEEQNHHFCRLTSWNPNIFWIQQTKKLTSSRKGFRLNVWTSCRPSEPQLSVWVSYSH